MSYATMYAEKRGKFINGRPIEQLEMIEYDRNGQKMIQGNYNGQPFYYTNVPVPISKKRTIKTRTKKRRKNKTKKRNSKKK